MTCKKALTLSKKERWLLDTVAMPTKTDWQVPIFDDPVKLETVVGKANTILLNVLMA